MIPAFGMWGAGALVVLVVLIGLFSNTMVGWLVAASASAVVTGVAQHPHFALWHGLTLALMLSVTALLGGTLLALNHRMIAMRDMVWRPTASDAFDAITRACTCAAGALTQRLDQRFDVAGAGGADADHRACGLWAFSTGLSGRHRVRCWKSGRCP